MLSSPKVVLQKFMILEFLVDSLNLPCCFWGENDNKKEWVRLRIIINNQSQLLKQYFGKLLFFRIDRPGKHKTLHNIWTKSAQRLRRWSNIVHMLYKCSVVTWETSYLNALLRNPSQPLWCFFIFQDGRHYVARCCDTLDYAIIFIAFEIKHIEHIIHVHYQLCILYKIICKA